MKKVLDRKFLKKQVSQGYTADVLRTLNEYNPASSLFENEIKNITARFNKLRVDNRSGTLTDAEYRARLNKLNQNLLELLDHIPIKEKVFKHRLFRLNIHKSFQFIKIVIAGSIILFLIFPSSSFHAYISLKVNRISFRLKETNDLFNSQFVNELSFQNFAEIRFPTDGLKLFIDSVNVPIGSNDDFLKLKPIRQDHTSSMDFLSPVTIEHLKGCKDAQISIEIDKRENRFSIIVVPVDDIETSLGLAPNTEFTSYMNNFPNIPLEDYFYGQFSYRNSTSIVIKGQPNRTNTIIAKTTTENSIEEKELTIQNPNLFDRDNKRTKSSIIGDGTIKVSGRKSFNIQREEKLQLEHENSIYLSFSVDSQYIDLILQGKFKDIKLAGQSIAYRPSRLISLWYNQPHWLIILLFLIVIILVSEIRSSKSNFVRQF